MTRGNWSEVWDSFDRRQKAKASGEGGGLSAEGGGSEDIFSWAGIGVE